MELCSSLIPQTEHASLRRVKIGRLLEDPSLMQTPIAVLGNKIDIPVAASEHDLRHQLGLYAHVTCGTSLKKGDAAARPVELFMCSVVKRVGYGEAFEWH